MKNPVNLSPSLALLSQLIDVGGLKPFKTWSEPKLHHVSLRLSYFKLEALGGLKAKFRFGPSSTHGFTIAYWAQDMVWNQILRHEVYRVQSSKVSSVVWARGSRHKVTALGSKALSRSKVDISS